ncbi:MAG: BPSS1780 family membrane protein [Hydrogenophilus sp.]|nr:BPSS1780 family membrane protein [Hydrogenophilus sp.]
MRARILSFSDGWRWMIAGLLLVRRAPALTAFVTFGYLLLLLFVSAVPLIGPFLAALLMPILQIGVLAGMRAAERLERPSPDILFHGFKVPWQPLAAVGALNYLANLLILLLVDLSFGNPITVKPVPPPHPSLEGDPLFLPIVDLSALLLFLTLSLPVTAAYWYAPPLIAWHGVPWPKALFFSLYAVFKNWLPLLSWTLSWGALLAALALIVGWIASLTHPLVFYLLLFLLPLVTIPALFAGYYLQVKTLFLPSSA